MVNGSIYIPVFNRLHNADNLHGLYNNACRKLGIILNYRYSNRISCAIHKHIDLNSCNTSIVGDHHWSSNQLVKYSRPILHQVDYKSWWHFTRWQHYCYSIQLTTQYSCSLAGHLSAEIISSAVTEQLRISICSKVFKSCTSLLILSRSWS